MVGEEDTDTVHVRVALGESFLHRRGWPHALFRPERAHASMNHRTRDRSTLDVPPQADPHGTPSPRRDTRLGGHRPESTLSHPGRSGRAPHSATARGGGRPSAQNTPGDPHTRERGAAGPHEDDTPQHLAVAPDRVPQGLPFRSATTPQDAFDALYTCAAPGLIHQIRLLTGRRGFAFEAVEHAFHHAWEHWPEVAVDADPVGWVRARAYDYALSPWHGFRPAFRRPEPRPAEPILQALLDMPGTYSRVALLCDGLGLSVSQAAVETEGSTAATRSRLLHARTAIGQLVPGLDDDPGALRERLSTLVTEVSIATLPSAGSTRAGSERRIRILTRSVCGLLAALVTAATLATVTAPAGHEPDRPGGRAVNSPPPRADAEQAPARRHEPAAQAGSARR
jgi:DNA-directed RNA polymerase specialized sigma24 family protein